MSQLEDITSTTITKFLIHTQRLYNDTQYKNKAPEDRITCIICGNTYSRRHKNLHDNSKKHQTNFDNFCNQICQNLKVS